ncbi:MAG: DUF1569 domain-containing protein [Pseudomonadales bacterium]|nr:DUF1569 domain-containing protein [Pseudomonadales bacterium]
MKRRRLLSGALAGSTAIAVGGSVAWLNVEASDAPLDIDSTLAILDQLSKASITTIGEWNLFQIYSHCAQSVEYSMTGYPQHKSEFFKSTIGPMAFSVFSEKRKMRHGLSEAIPGAPAIAVQGNMDQALERFKKSLIDFKNYKGELQPHFAYGPLSKAEYELAHAMHFQNHLEEFKTT